MRQVILAATALALMLAAAGFYLRSDGGANISEADDEDEARAVLRNAAGEQVGVIKFSSEDDEGTEVKVKIDAPLGTLSAGFHGFHIHGTGTCTADATQPDSTWFTSAGGHYKDTDPAHAYHGAHNGDMPLILVLDDGDGRGEAEARFVTDRFDPSEIAGKAVIVHKVADNYRNIPLGADARQYTPNTNDVNDTATATGFTAATGNAGSRVACGVIEG